MKRALLVLITAGLLVAASAATIEITNGTGSWDIYYIYISPSTSDSWGDDWLGSEIMSPGDTWEFTVQSGTWDIKLVDEDGDEYIRYNVPVSGTYTWYATLDDLGENWMSGGDTGYGNAPVTIYNDLGSWTIYYIYCSSSSSSEWGGDWLGSDVVAPGESFTFYVSSGDYYDIQCEDEDGDTYSLYEVWVGGDGFYWSVDLNDID
jgi:hypothetical protein